MNEILVLLLLEFGQWDGELESCSDVYEIMNSPFPWTCHKNIDN